MTATAYLEHTLGHRTRLRFRQQRGDEPFFHRLRERLSQHPDIQEVRASPRTGGVLVLHRLPLQELLEYAEAEGLFQVTTSRQRASAAALARRNIRGVERRLLEASRGEIDSHALMMLALAGLTVTQVARGQLLAPASSYLWYLFQMLDIGGSADGNGDADGE